MALRAACVTVALLLPGAAAGTAQAVLAPEYYEEARRSAVNHLQIAIENVGAPADGMGACAVAGSVVRVFRGGLKAGEPIVFTVACYHYGSIPDGATLWTDYRALSRARYLEAFMTGDTPPRVMLDQVEIVLAPRDRPYCDSNTLYCESANDALPPKPDCGITGRIWTWLGLGDCG
jgi:hypothetical protein